VLEFAKNRITLDTKHRASEKLFFFFFPMVRGKKKKGNEGEGGGLGLLFNL